MSKKNIDEFKEIPEDILNEVTDDDFGKTIDENQSSEGQNHTEEEPEDAIVEEIVDKAAATEQIDLGEFFDPEDLTEFQDLVMTPLSGAAYTSMKLDYKESEIGYTASNKKTLNKINKKVLAYLKVTKINPLVLMFLALIIIPLMKGGRLWLNKKMLEDAEEKGYKRGKKDKDAEDAEIIEAPAKKKTAKKKPVKKKTIPLKKAAAFRKEQGAETND
jgi:hypothetical protein